MINAFLSDDHSVTDDIMRRYAVFLLSGFSIHGYSIAVDTIKEYFAEVNRYYVHKGFRKPFDYKDSSPASRLLREQKKFEDEPDKRDPLTEEMCIKMMDLAKEYGNLSFQAAVWNFTALGRYGGFRAQEFCMDSPHEIRFYICPNGDYVIRAFTYADFVFYDAHDVQVLDPLRHKESCVVGGQRYKIQKNRMNGQIITQKRSAEYPQFCALEHMFQILERAEALDHGSQNDPLCVYKDDVDIKFLTGNNITAFYRTVLSSIQPEVTDAKLKLISTHSLRVYACVLLHEANKDGTYIKLRLRWKSDCFEVYLRNTKRIRAQHQEALEGTNAMMAKLVADAAVDGNIADIRFGGTEDTTVDLEDEAD